MRSDTTARDSIRKFINWADTNFVGETADDISDQIAKRYDSYLHALKKHGVRKKLALVASLYDLRAKVGGAGAAAGLHALGFGPTATAVAATSLALGEVTISIAKKLLDLGDKAAQIHATHAEVAFWAR